MKKEEGRGGDRIADIYKFMKEREVWYRVT